MTVLRNLLPFALLLSSGLSLMACGPEGPNRAVWPPVAKKWYERARDSYRHGDVEDARISIEHALRLQPERPEVRVVAARVALAELEYERALQLLDGVESAKASGLRGRAYWYSGKIAKAADSLDELLADPDVRDPWAQEIAKLARTGVGRKPFEVSGGLLAVSEMAEVPSTALVVPLEVDGEQALGMIATGSAETVVDGREPRWISIRFAERIEVKNVPALAKDLSGISRQVNAPIKVLLGVNLLRRLHPTFDFAGDQFVVRTFEPPPPPQATSVPLAYIHGGGMFLRGALGAEQEAPLATLLVDTSMTFPLALDMAAWKKAGVDVSSFDPVPNGKGLSQGSLPMLRLGAFEVPKVPGVLGVPLEAQEKELEMDLDGVLGSGLLASFRVTLFDGGRAMWLEDLPAEVLEQGAPRPPKGPPPGKKSGAEAPKPTPKAATPKGAAGGPE